LAEAYRLNAPTGARALELCGQELMSSYIGKVGTRVGSFERQSGLFPVAAAAVAGSNPTAGVGRKRNGGFGAERGKLPLIWHPAAELFRCVCS
jgi:hypothetical protein